MKFSPKILITGSTGFIGAALIAKLFTTEDWRDVIFLVRSKLPEVKFGKRKKIPSSYVRPPMSTQHIVPDFF